MSADAVVIPVTVVPMPVRFRVNPQPESVTVRQKSLVIVSDKSLSPVLTSLTVESTEQIHSPPVVTKLLLSAGREDTRWIVVYGSDRH